MRPLKEQIKQVAQSGYKDTVLSLLDSVKDYIADARNGDWSTEVRKASIVAIDNVLYNKIKNASQQDKQSESDEWI